MPDLIADSSSPSAAPVSTQVPLPLVVQVGFAGSRTLFADEAERPALEAALRPMLEAHLRDLRAGLGLEPRHFLCGISQIAIGADTLFTKACAALGLVQRIFLPQPADDFLQATGSKGPDFSAAQQEEARRLLASPHIIQQRVVSQSPVRTERFEETNLEIARVSDVVICLIRAGSGSEAGGTGHLQEVAGQRKVPVLRLEVSVENGAPKVQATWLHRECFARPTLPQALHMATMPAAGAPPERMPDVPSYYRALKSIGSQEAEWMRHLVAWSARIIISAHVVATLLAATALASHSGGEGLAHALVPWLLGLELFLLGVGFGVHSWLHHRRATETWALSRVVAEVSRSASSTAGINYYPEYFFHLPYPPALRPLLRTVNVLHQRSSSPCAGDGGWKTVRAEYLRKRIFDPTCKAQLPYHRDNERVAERRLRGARRIFLVCSGGAIAATLLEFLENCGMFQIESHFFGGLLGVLAIGLPVLAVGVLSLAAVFDLEARVRVSSEMVGFLEAHSQLLNEATTHREFARLLLEMEFRLLGENVNWYNRRAFTAVS